MFAPNATQRPGIKAAGQINENPESLPSLERFDQKGKDVQNEWKCLAELLVERNTPVVCCVKPADLLQNNSNMFVESAKPSLHDRHALHLRSQVGVLLEDLTEWRFLVFRACVWTRIQIFRVSDNIFHPACQGIDIWYNAS